MDLEDFEKNQMQIAEHKLGVYISEYDFRAERWRDLDRKSQSTITIAGVFIASNIAFFKQINLQISNVNGLRFLFLFLLIILLMTIAFSALALRIREIVHPPTGDSVNSLIPQDLSLNSKVEMYRFSRNFTYDQIGLWKQSLNSITKANIAKSKYLIVAYICLFITILSETILVLFLAIYT